MQGSVVYQVGGYEDVDRLMDYLNSEGLRHRTVSIPGLDRHWHLNETPPELTREILEGVAEVTARGGKIRVVLN